MGWLATTMDKTAICRLIRIDWDTVGRIIERVMATGLDPNRLKGLFQIGVIEVSWRKGHKYITFVSDHATRRFVWAKGGKDAATLDSFFDELGSQGSKAITEISMNMGPRTRKAPLRVPLRQCCAMTHCSKASRSGLKPFVTVAKTVRKRLEGILAAVRLGINNGRHEGLNRRVRLIVNRAYGFHSAEAAIGLVMLSLDPITHVLPHERTPVPTG